MCYCFVQHPESCPSTCSSSTSLDSLYNSNKTNRDLLNDSFPDILTVHLYSRVLLQMCESVLEKQSPSLSGRAALLSLCHPHCQGRKIPLWSWPGTSQQQWGQCPLMAAGYMHLASMTIALIDSEDRKEKPEASQHHPNNPPNPQYYRTEGSLWKAQLTDSWHLHQNKGGMNTKPGEN